MRCFFAYLKREMKVGSLYRADFVLKLVYGLIAMYGARCLWVALYHQNPAIVGRELSSMITYAMLAMALDIVFYPSSNPTAPHMYIMAQMRTGRIDTDLLRPMNLQKQLLLRNASSMIFSALGLVLPACVVALLFFGMQSPASGYHAAAFVISCALSYMILFSMNFMLGLVSIVTTDIRQITWAYNGLVSILSGKLVPLWLFPGWMQSVSDFLPFRYVFEAPLNIYTGALVGADVMRMLLMQCAWTGVLILLGQLFWARVHRRLTVQGG